MNQTKLRRRMEENPDAKLRDLVTELMYEDIIGLRLPIGSKLNVNQIAASFGVSRTPVAEAISDLEEQGFIVTKPGMSGFYVIDLNPADMLDLYRVRSAIEGEAAALCARSADNSAIAQLKELAAAFKDSLLRKDAAGMKQTDLPFHQLIVNSCNNPYILQSYNAIMPKITMYQASALELIADSFSADSSAASDLAFSHIAVTSAIDMRLPELARQAMSDHISTSISLITTSGLNDFFHRTAD